MKGVVKPPTLVHNGCVSALKLCNGELPFFTLAHSAPAIIRIEGDAVNNFQISHACPSIFIRNFISLIFHQISSAA